MDKHLKEILLEQIRNNTSLYKIARYWGCSFRDIKLKIQNDKDLYSAFVLYKSRSKMCSCKKNHKKCFNMPLSKYGCCKLVNAIVLRAVEDGDVNFFNSVNFVFYQPFLNNDLEASDYIKFIETKTGFKSTDL